ncbi:MAG: CPBP family intramembrane glutamic endopeptidase [Promethearchaeota archaeon]
MLNLKTRTSKLIITITLAVICMVLFLLIVAVINPDSLYWGLFLTTGQLVATLILIRFLNLSKEDLGLAYNKSKFYLHILSIFSLLVIVVFVKYLVEGVQSVNDISFTVMYYFFFYIVVAITEELYFRGILYNILESWSKYAALIGSSVVFGLFHIRSGLIVVVIMIFTGLSFAVVRYVSGMNHLLIPFHFLFNFQSALIVFNDSTMVSGTLYLGLSLLVVIIFVLIESRTEKKTP